MQETSIKREEEDEVPVEDVAVQVSTLGLEQSSGFERRKETSEEGDATLPIPGVIVSEDEVDVPSLTRVDIYKTELEKAIEDSEENLNLLEILLSEGAKGKPTHDQLVRSKYIFQLVRLSWIGYIYMAISFIKLNNLT